MLYVLWLTAHKCFNVFFDKTFGNPTPPPPLFLPPPPHPGCVLGIAAKRLSEEWQTLTGSVPSVWDRHRWSVLSTAVALACLDVRSTSRAA